jgi:type IV secretory pathway TrbL component
MKNIKHVVIAVTIIIVIIIIIIFFVSLKILPKNLVLLLWICNQRTHKEEIFDYELCPTIMKLVKDCLPDKRTHKGKIFDYK